MTIAAAQKIDSTLSKKALLSKARAHVVKTGGSRVTS